MTKCFYENSQGCTRRARYWLKIKNKSVGHRFSGEETRFKICEYHYNKLNPEHKHRVDRKGATDGLFPLGSLMGASDEQIQFGYEQGYTDDFIAVFSRMH